MRKLVLGRGTCFGSVKFEIPQVSKVVGIRAKEEAEGSAEGGHVLERGVLVAAVLVLHQFVEQQLHRPHKQYQHKWHRDLAAERATLSNLFCLNHSS